MKTSNQFNRFLNITSVVSALLISSCSSNTETQTPAPVMHILKVGDSFTYHNHDADTAGVATSRSDTTITAIVTRTAIPIAGKNAVTEIVKGSDTTYLAEANDSSFSLLQNQVGIISGTSIPAVWVSFDPAKSGKTAYDSTQNATISGMPAKIHTTVVMHYLGKDATTIGGSSVVIFKFSKVVTVIVTIFGQDYTATVTVPNDYAPSIGYLTQHIAKTISDSQQSAVPNGINYSLLQRYLLK